MWAIIAVHVVLAILLSSFMSCKSREKQSRLTIAVPAQITSLDPAYAITLHQIWVVNQIYEPLFRVDSTLSIEPLLVDSWAVSPDRTVYTFYLKRGVYFHQDTCFETPTFTRELNAYDVLSTYSRLIDTVRAVPARWIFAGKLDPDTPFLVLDSFVIQIRLRKPFVPFLGLLATPQSGILPREAIDKYGDGRLHTHAVGTGPFKLVQFNKERVVLAEYDYYWNRRAPHEGNVKFLYFQYVPERQLELQLLLTGEIDLISGPPPVVLTSLLDPSGVPRPAYSERLVIKVFPYLNVEYIGIVVNRRSLPAKYRFLAKKEFRKALSLVLDRKQIVESFRFNQGEPGIYGFVHPYMYRLHNVEPPAGYSFDPRGARRLLKEADIDVDELPEIPLYTTPEYSDFAQFFASSVKEHLGIEIDIRVVDPAFLAEKKARREALLFRASWIADYPDPESFFTPFVIMTSPPNYTGFYSRTLLRLYRKAIREEDEKMRWELYVRMDSILIDEAPVIVLYYDEGMLVYRRDVSGVHTNPMNWISLGGVQKFSEEAM